MIELREVTLDYAMPRKHTRRVLAGVNLRVPKGQLLCLVGPSGCGKTSLLNLVAGFLKPTSGHVLFDGKPVTAPGPGCGVVFQEPTLFPWLTVRRNVAFGLRRQGFTKSEVKCRTAEALAIVGLGGQEDAFPHALSGGMRQRAAIARVLVLEPKAILMDEPFSALDANARERLQDEVVRIWEHKRCTIVYVTHSVEEAAYLGDRVVVMAPPPAAIAGDTEVSLPRPRDRSSSILANRVRGLRDRLDALPCCVTNSK